MGVETDQPDTGPDPSEETSPDDQASTDGGSEPTIESDLRALRTILENTGRSHRLASFVEGALWFVAALGAVVLTALVVGLLVPAAVPAWTGWVLILGGGALAVAAVGGVVRFVRSAPGAAGIARRLQDVEPSFRNDLVAAIEFGEAMLESPEASDEQLGFSRTLARAHLRRTVERVRDRSNGAGHLGDMLPDRNIEPPLLAVAGCLVLMSGSAWLAPEATGEILRSPMASSSSSEDGDDQIERPIVGDIRLTYSPPDYTDMGRRTASGSTGHIETVVGSEVTLETYPLMDVEDVEMVLETDSGRRTVSMEESSGGSRLTKTFVVTEPGEYHFRAKRPDGTRVNEGATRSIELVEDRPPSVSITSHEGRVQVSPEDVLEIEFAVEDDFGIDEIERVHYFAGSEDSKTVEPVDVGSLSDQPKKAEGSFKFDLRPLSLKPKDTVVFRLQATDNNSRTGPSIGKSPKLRLRVSSPEDKHLENIQKQRKLSEKLVSLLADYLENPVGDRQRRRDNNYAQVVPADLEGAKLADRLETLANIHDKQGGLVEEMGELADQLDEDPLASERDRNLFEGLHGHLRDLHEDGESVLEAIRRDGEIPSEVGIERGQRGADYAADAEAALEKTILQLQELIASEKMDAIKASREDIKDAKNRLKELLKKYKKSDDPELKKAIKREIDRLRQRMNEMMQRMRMQIRNLPERHVNEEALEKKQLESGTQKMADDLSSVEKKLEEGDIDGALEALENMDSNLSKLSKEMDSQFESAQPEGLSKMDKEISKMMDRVNDMEAAEKELEEETEKLQRQQEKRRQQKIEQMLDEFTEKLLGQVAKQLESLQTIDEQNLETYEQSGLGDNRQALERLKEMLEQKDIEQALEAAGESLDNLQTLRFNLDLAKRHAERAEAAERATREVGEMVPRGKQIKRKLERMMKRAQSRRQKAANNQEMKKLAERQKKLRKQAQQLRKDIKKASKEFPMMKQKMKPGIEKAEKQMKQAEKRLGKGESQGALDSERSALEQLGQLKKSMKQTLKKKSGQGKGGNGAQRREDVEIPGNDDGASQEELREEVMEGMKGEKLEKYDEEIKEYYKSLVE